MGKREKKTARRFVAFVVERKGKYLVRQRSAGTVNAHLWEFPNVEVAAGILPAVEPGVPPGGKDAGNFKPVKLSRKIPGGRMPPSTAGGTPAATRLQTPQTISASNSVVPNRFAQLNIPSRAIALRWTLTAFFRRDEFHESPFKTSEVKDSCNSSLR